MARIKTARHGHRTVVTLAGALTADDMRRVEHACGGALTVDPPPLTVNVAEVSTIDQSALAVLRHLESRGAEISGRPLGAIPTGVHQERGRTTVRVPGATGAPRRVLRQYGDARADPNRQRRDTRDGRHR